MIIFSPKRLDLRSNAIPCYSESVREMIETGPLANTSCQSWLFGYSPEYFIRTRFWVTYYNHLYVYWMHGPLESDLVKLKKWFVVESKCTGVAVAIKPNRIWNGCAFLWTVFGNIVIKPRLVSWLYAYSPLFHKMVRYMHSKQISHIYSFGKRLAFEKC